MWSGWMLTLLWGMTAYAAPAEELPEGPACGATSWESVDTSASRLADAYAELDTDRFRVEAESLDRAITCLAEPITTEQAAVVHAHRGLAGFVLGELESSRRSWAAYRTLEPDTPPDARWMPRDHPMRQLYDRPPERAAPVVLEREPVGGWRVDGVETAEVPGDRAFFLQGIDAAGEVIHSGHHLTVAEVPQVDFRALDPTLRARRRARAHRIGTTGAGALVAGSAVTLVMGLQQEARVKDRSTPIADVEPAAVSANTLGGVAAGLAAGAAAVVVTTWTIRW